MLLFIGIASFGMSLWFLSHLDHRMENDRTKSKLLWYLSHHIIGTAFDLAYLDVSYNVLDHTDPLTKNIIYETSLEPHYAIAFGIWCSILAEAFVVTIAPKPSHISHDIDHHLMIVHHVITLGLLAISFYLQLKAFGVLILFLHDISDICVTATKIAAKFKFSTLLIPSYISMISTWIYFRLYWFSWELVYTSLWSSFSTFTFLMQISTGLLTILACFHMWWFILMLRLAGRQDKVHIYENTNSD